MTIMKLPKRFLLLCLISGALSGCAGKYVPPDYSKYVWPPPPDEPRVQLEEIYYGRADVEATSSLQRTLIGATPDRYARMIKPFGVAYDPQGRVLVSDQGLAAVLRFDREHKVMDVLGTRGGVKLKVPLGVTVAPDGRIFVADVDLGMVVVLDAEGTARETYGQGELSNPTDVALSPDGTRLYVADSKRHRVVVFDVETRELLDGFGQRGEAGGDFAFPTSLAFDPDGNLLVVDQLNSRVQVLTADGDFLYAQGALNTTPGNFVRPKDVAVDEEGVIYVTDAAFNNVQLFDPDFSLLTFVGSGGRNPGQFQQASGVAVRGDRFAVVDQINRRVQLFRFIAPKDSQ